MNRAILLMILGLFAFGASPALAQSDDPNVNLLLQRLASFGDGPAEIFVAQLPPGMPEVPLPAARFIGGVVSQRRPGVAKWYQMFYSSTAGGPRAYTSALTSAGWKPRAFPGFPHGGFADTRVFSTFCKAGSPTVTVQSPGSDDLRVQISQPDGTPDVFCGGPQAIVPQTPLPDLAAPPGATMNVSMAGNPQGASGAAITSSLPLSKLLGFFSAQFTAAGWTAGDMSTSSRIGSQSFGFTDTKGVRWQTVLTVYAVDGTPGMYLAFTDITDLSNLPKRSGAATTIDLTHP